MPAPRAVVVADPIDRAALDRLRAADCRVVDATAGPEALAAALPDAWALLVRSRTRVTAALLDAAPNLRVIARAGVGVDNVDLDAATRRSVRVVNAPTAATTSVAELTVALLLLLVRDLYGAIPETKAGRWPRGVRGAELAGKTVGLVGYGRIGREVARRVEAFGATVLAHDPWLPRSPDHVPLLPLDELLPRAHLLSLHAAANDANRHLLNAERLARLPRGAYVVNVARGALVYEEALLAALDSGPVAGAALDVFEVEPPTRRRLLEHPRVIATPHLGASTPEAQTRAGAQVAEELERLLRGERPLYLVNTELATAP